MNVDKMKAGRGISSVFLVGVPSAQWGKSPKVLRLLINPFSFSNPLCLPSYPVSSLFCNARKVSGFLDHPEHKDENDPRRGSKSKNGKVVLQSPTWP